MKKRVLITIVSVLMLCVFAFAFTACDKASAEVLDMAKQVLFNLDEAYKDGVEVLQLEYAKMESYEYWGIDCECYWVRIVLEFVTPYGLSGYNVYYQFWYRDSAGNYRREVCSGADYAYNVPNAKETGKLSKIQIKELNKYIKEN